MAKTDTKEKRAVRTLALFEDAGGWLFGRGYYLQGMTIKNPQSNCLIVLRAVTAEGPRVAFVGGLTAVEATAKAAELIRQDKLLWREDEFLMKKLAEEG